MRTLISILAIVIMSTSMHSQTSEEEEVKAAVVAFFDAFHKQDTVALKAMAKGNVKLQSIGTNPQGKTVFSENDYNEFVKSIGSIPKENTFEEKLLGFTIKIDGQMANAWTPYEFWYNGNFSHCGVNSFQFMKENGKWKIIYLVDTRRREGCQS